MFEKYEDNPGESWQPNKYALEEERNFLSHFESTNIARLARVFIGISYLLLAPVLFSPSQAKGFEKNKIEVAASIEQSNTSQEQLQATKERISRVLEATRDILQKHSPPARIDKASCVLGSGVVSILLQSQGDVSGKDYEVRSARAHVYIWLPEESLIVDPTFPQFFKENSVAYNIAMSQSGFIGTMDELRQFLLEHRKELKSDTVFSVNINKIFAGDDKNFEEASNQYLSLMQ